MARQCDLCLRRSQRYKLHWKTINKKSKVANIYNEQHRLRYYYYNSISFQKLRGEFKIQCKNLIWFNSSIYDARKNDLKCTPMTSKWVTMKSNVKKCVKLMAVTLISTFILHTLLTQRPSLQVRVTHKCNQSYFSEF